MVNKNNQEDELKVEQDKEDDDEEEEIKKYVYKLKIGGIKSMRKFKNLINSFISLLNEFWFSIFFSRNSVCFFLSCSQHNRTNNVSIRW